jgi:hypothetical protein
MSGKRGRDTREDKRTALVSEQLMEGSPRERCFEKKNCEGMKCVGQK